jgi:hypothetical protein
MSNHINRTYAATTAGATVFVEQLPPGYRGASFVNNSGHYLLIRLGGSDGPVDSNSADMTIPPYTAAGISLTGGLIAGRFTDTVAPIVTSLATGNDGVCTAQYSPEPVSAYMVALPGASPGQPTQPVPAGGLWARQSRLRDFPNPVSGAAFQEILAGPATVRYISVSYGDKASGLQPMFIYKALTATPTVVGEYIAEGELCDRTTIPAYLRPIEFGPSASGAEVVLKAVDSIFAATGNTIASVLLYCEYRL